MYHSKTITEIEKELDTNLVTGLDENKVINRTNKNNKNELIVRKKDNAFKIFIRQLTDPLIYILGIAFVISLLLKEYIDAIIILIVVLINAIIGTFEELKAEKALEALKKMTSPHCLVKRNNKIIEIPVKDLVVGDLVVLETGRTVPADLRLTKAINLKIDESSLTGESIPVVKNSDVILNKDTPIADRVNVCYMSSNVVYGHGEGIVISIGMNTQIGTIAKMLNEQEKELTPLQKKLAGLGKFLGILSISICLLLLMVALLQKRNVIEMLITSISLAVAAIPEGLVAIVTIVLSLGVSKMVKVNTIVRKLHSVETLGSVNVICSDKTGTLTQNKMKVVEAYMNHKNYEINKFDRQLETLALGLALCNDAKIENDKEIGDPTEVALLSFYKNIDSLDKLDKYKRIDEIPFDSDRKMMSTLHQKDFSSIMFCKGALDKVILKCNSILINNKVIPLSNNDKQEIIKASDNMADKALRVLALAYKETNKLDENNLIFIGMVGMIDPPRNEAILSIKRLKKAGISTIMITGDHKKTAMAIAKQLDIASNENQCLSGNELDLLSDKQLKENIYKYKVFARVSPLHKVRIVKALKENGNIVAMTGDGVNDAPSLKAADVGISMGITGTDVAKNASDIILSDDNFSSIEKAIEEGRGIYTNIKKSLLFLLSSNIGEILTMFLGVLLNLPIPLLAIHILWVNLLTDSLPALALGQDDNGKQLMDEKPRDVKESLFAHGGLKILIGYGLLIGIVSLSAYLIVPISYCLSNGISVSYHSILNVLKISTVLKRAQTYAFCTLALSQLYHSIGMKNMVRSAFDNRLFKNKLLIVSFLLGYFIQILVTELPFLNEIFKTTHLHLMDWIIISLFSMMPLLVHEIIALFKKNHS